MSPTWAELLERMWLIREFEAVLPDLTKQGLIRGATHPASGMEAVAVGMTADLVVADSVVSNHRGHGHCLAKGARADRMMAEILGRDSGYCRGRGGSMHIGVKELGILGTNGIVGGGIGVATGSALAASVTGHNEVTVVFFGDGALNQGVLAEAMNFAAIRNLPIVFACENNQYAQSAAVEAMSGNIDLASRGDAYGVPSTRVDGMDLRAVREAGAAAIERARRGEGPSFIVADTYRYGGHNGIGDTESYRSAEEVEAWRKRDPIERLAGELTAAGELTETEVQQIHERVLATITEAVEFAIDSDHADVRAGLDDVYEKEMA